MVGCVLWCVAVYRDRQTGSEVLLGAQLASIPDSVEYVRVSRSSHMWVDTQTVSFADTPQNIRSWILYSPGLSPDTRVVDSPRAGAVYRVGDGDGGSTTTFIDEEERTVEICRIIAFPDVEREGPPPGERRPN